MAFVVCAYAHCGGTPRRVWLHCVCVVEGTAAQQPAPVATAYCRAPHSSRVSDEWAGTDSLIAFKMEPSVPSVGSRG
jgi:hypothetical protein